LTLRTYLVEDSEIIRTNLQEALLELGNAEVVAHADGEAQARDWFDEHPDDWDLAVVDLFLREGSGLGLLRSQRCRAPEQRVVVLSNYATCDMRERCTRLGVDAVFDKSTELDDLLAWCRSLRQRP
jgi:DNA-binding NarL/FixJ family response regulator